MLKGRRPVSASIFNIYLTKNLHHNTSMCNFFGLIAPRVYLVDEDRRVIDEKHYRPGSTVELHW